MKRSALKRKSPLQRGSSTLKRSVLRAEPAKRKRRATIPAATRDAVKRRSGGRCIVCLYRSGRRLALVRHEGRIEERHHVLPVEKFPEYELEEANLVGLCRGCHDEHTRAHRRVPWEALPDVTIAWVYSRGGREWHYLCSTYPRWGTVRGGSAR